MLLGLGEAIEILAQAAGSYRCTPIRPRRPRRPPHTRVPASVDCSLDDPSFDQVGGMENGDKVCRLCAVRLCCGSCNSYRLARTDGKNQSGAVGATGVSAQRRQGGDAETWPAHRRTAEGWGSRAWRRSWVGRGPRCVTTSSASPPPQPLLSKEGKTCARRTFLPVLGETPATTCRLAARPAVLARASPRISG